LPTFRSNKALDMARDVKEDVKAFLSGKRSERQRFERIQSEIERTHDEAKSSRRERYRKMRELHSKRQEHERIKNDLYDKTQELKWIKNELSTAKGKAQRNELKEPRKRTRTELNDLRERKSRTRQEISQLASELGAAKEEQAGDVQADWLVPAGDEKPQTGALPDFLIIGGKKCGTSSLYHLLTQHPLVEPAATKELHFFSLFFDRGIEWYRQCFPTPRWKGGQRTITGEATPYITRQHTPERVAGVIPQARLIALLRNPVERAYSDYQHEVREGLDTRTFEEAIGADKKAQPLGKGDEASETEAPSSGLDDKSRYLYRGHYVDQLLRWSEFFSKEQLLMLKSEDFFERPQETLKAVLGFLELPEWEPRAREVRINKGEYEQGMDPATRRLLEDYFEPHNRRLYDYLGVDFGW
jgi:cell fate (sporulation/competence/biofilm development) regulator YlbF (YheA/YmcA/DUF963 family)